MFLTTSESLRIAPLRILRYVLIAAALAFFIFPIFWLITTSFKNDVDVFAMPPKLLVFTPTLKNFIHVFNETDIPQLAANSLIASLSNVVLSLIIGTMAAYGISRFKAGGKNLLFWFLSLRMLPPIVVSIPLFLVAAKLRLIDTQLILPLMYLLLNVPFVIWMMKSFIDEIPLDIEESALIDGCSYFGTLWRIVLPMITPGLVATGVLCFIFAWNEFLIAMIFTRVNATTLPVGLSGFITTEQVFWGYLTASATVAALPPLVLAWIFQRYMVRGLTLGAVKT
jgi:multiple sugar transport system permease protein